MRTDTERLNFLLQVMESEDEDAAERIQGAFMLGLKGRTALDAAMGAKLVEPGEPMPELTALDLAVAELGRIRNVKGFSEERDDGYVLGELADAGACYVAGSYLKCNDMAVWPWGENTYKPSPDDRKRELTKGIALALCELDRLIRAERREESNSARSEHEQESRLPDTGEPEAQREFKVGDRVRVIGRSESQDVAIGALGTVREAKSCCPWIEFDEPTGFPDAVDRLGIPAGYAYAVYLRNLEHVDG